jgi:hypothetical protein
MDRILVGLSMVVGVVGCVLPPAAEPQPLPWGAQPAAAAPSTTEEVADTEVAYADDAYADDEAYAEPADTGVAYGNVTYQETVASPLAGRWVSTEWATVTNAAYASADFYLDISVASDGSFSGSWARFVCLTGAYGIISCSLNNIEGSAHGRLDADGTGQIELERLGRSHLAWSTTANGISIELPSNWQGDRVLYRTAVHR